LSESLTKKYFGTKIHVILDINYLRNNKMRTSILLLFFIFAIHSTQACIVQYDADVNVLWWRNNQNRSLLSLFSKKSHLEPRSLDDVHYGAMRVDEKLCEGDGSALFIHVDFRLQRNGWRLLNVSVAENEEFAKKHAGDFYNVY
jgi:hypothetical protein